MGSLTFTVLGKLGYSGDLAVLMYLDGEKLRVAGKVELP
jgi:hypothetical protein